MTATAFLDGLQTAAKQAEAKEAAFRREISTRFAALERERAFAYRRLNLMKAIVEAIAPAEDGKMAVVYALAMLQTRLGWETDSEARAAVLAHFAPVAQAVFVCLTADDGGADVSAALSQFETWYTAGHATPFWTLFEHHMPETPRVDF